MNEIVKARMIRQVARDIAGAVMDAPAEHGFELAISSRSIAIWKYKDGEGNNLPISQTREPFYRIWLDVEWQKFDALNFLADAEICLAMLREKTMEKAA